MTDEEYVRSVAKERRSKKRGATSPTRFEQFGRRPLMESRCSHPDCTVELGITETDLGPLCGLHIQHAKDIMRGEERLISAEVRIRELEAQLAELKRGLR